MSVKMEESYKTMLEAADNLLEAKNYSQAIVEYKKVIQANPEYIPALNKLARAYRESGAENAEEQAISIYKHIVEINPKQEKTLTKLARLQAKHGDYQSAIAAFKKAIVLNPDQPDWVFTTLGSSIRKLKQAESN